MNLLNEPIELNLTVEPKYAALLGGAIFLAIVLGSMLAVALFKLK